MQVNSQQRYKWNSGYRELTRNTNLDKLRDSCAFHVRRRVLLFQIYFDLFDSPA